MRARDLLATTLVALTAACAAQDVGEPPSAPPTALDVPATPLVTAEPADEELGLAEYERLLADKENRLRAAGVLLAARGQADAEAGDEARALGGGFAPPPPAPTGAHHDDAPTKKAKRASKSTSAGRGAAAPSSPAPEVASRSESPNRKREDKRVQYAPTPRPAATAEFSAESEPPADRCQTICDLSAATCELEGKICDLASRHADDPRYAALCRRADDDCRAAAEACQRCSQ